MDVKAFWTGSSGALAVRDIFSFASGILFEQTLCGQSFFRLVDVIMLFGGYFERPSPG